MLTKRILRLQKHGKRFLKLRNWFSGTNFQNLSQDPWKILGVNQNTNEKDVKKAYIKLVKKYHPDVVKDDGKKFKEIQKAYEIMSNPAKLNEYKMMNNQQRNSNPYNNTGYNPYGANYNQSGAGQGHRTGSRTYYYTSQGQGGSNPNQKFYYTYSTNNPGKNKTFDDVIRDAFYQQQREKSRGQNFYSSGFGNNYANRNRSRTMTEEERKKAEEEYKRAEEEILNFLKFGSFGFHSQSQRRTKKNDSNKGYDPFGRFDPNRDYREQYEKMYNNPQGFDGQSPFNPAAELQTRLVMQFLFYILLLFFIISVFRPRKDPYDERMSPEEAFMESQRLYDEEARIRARGNKELKEYVLVRDEHTGEVFETTRDQFNNLKRREYNRYNFQSRSQIR